mmetsp:Transcript_23748/g.25378  ORF Transcript_23748/g.25378 Transcript_23748/m.25378 type:complete len:710 (-) Transcript_23748:62-2191(-)
MTKSIAFRRLFLCLWLLDGYVLREVAGFPTFQYFASNFRRSLSPLSALSGADIEQETDEKPQPQVVGDTIIYRGKVNEIDYCIAPGDVSLSSVSGKMITKSDDDKTTSSQTMSLTKALNNASNRAVRRILLAKSWPSEEAFNLSLRLAAAAEKESEKIRKADKNYSTEKCPVPRPILNMLKPSRSTSNSSGITSPSSKSGVSGMASSENSFKKTRTNIEYVQDQINAFQKRYGSLPGYSDAEAFLESILSLATTGDESPRVKEVMKSDDYSQSYKRVLSVLKSAGVVFEQIEPGTNKFRIAKKLKNQNICLSIMDTLAFREESFNEIATSTATDRVNRNSEKDNFVENISVKNNEISDDDETDSPVASFKPTNTRIKNRLKFWKKNEEEVEKDQGESRSKEESKKVKKSVSSKSTDNGVILCSEEKSMTQQLNAFSNIVLRVLLFGDDQELLILSETLADNDKSFVDRWYPDNDPLSEKVKGKTRPGVQYLNALICLLRQAYKDGTVTNLEPMTTLIQSYSNSYERLIASLVEMGSGYIRPEEASDVMSIPKPRTAQEELGRFAVWESAFRSKDEKSYHPEDLEGDWEVKDVVGGETIGVSTVTFKPKGELMIAQPLQGLQWRLDPGPTHLDTCTFQVVSEDGTVLQYRGFIDRGARLEARFSGRSTRIRGSVMFQMRYSSVPDYWKVNMLPVNYLKGATKFEMTKSVK